jgi:hypothetical protein
VYGLYAVVLQRFPDPEGLQTYVTQLCAGLSPSSLLEVLAESEEGLRQGSQRPDPLSLAFVTGCYLTVLGRKPDRPGLEQNTAALQAGVPEGAILESFLQSPEALGSVRFPPAAQSPAVAVAEALQVVALGKPAEAGLTAALAREHLNGVPTVALVRGLMRRERRPRPVVRSFFGSGSLLRRVESEAATILLRRDLAGLRDWQWRVDRETLRRVASVAATVEDMGVRLDRDGPGATAGRPGSSR